MKLLDKILGKPPSQSEFAALMLRVCAEVGVQNLRYDETAFAFRAAGRDLVIYLSNVYADYCRVSRADRRAVVARFAAGFVQPHEIPSDFASASPRLMPVVRDPAYSSLARLHFQAAQKDGPGLLVPGAKVADELMVTLAWDTEHTIAAVNSECLERWGVSLEEAVKVAKDNLRERTDPGLMSEQAPGFYYGQWADSYESSRMLLTDLVYRLGVSGDPVAFIPNRNQFWVTGTQNVAGLKALLQTGEEAHFVGHPLSPNLYVLRDGSWHLYVPPEPDLRELWLALRRQRLALDYQQQKALLDAIYERDRNDVFVAACSLFRIKATGRVYSVCVWSKGVDALLPETEQIAFLIDPASKQKVKVPWQAARSVVGDLMEEEAELWPKRYRVRKFPNEEQISKLRELQEDIRTTVS